MDSVIFLDRDGVINVDLIGDYIKSWDEFKFEEGAIEALQKLNEKGYKIVIISNQAGVGDGVFSEAALDDVHENMLKSLAEKNVQIFSSFYCLHGKQEGCQCRKPAIGLFKKACHNLVFDRSNTYFVGDKATDMEAGNKFGIKTFFVRTGHGKNDESKLGGDSEPTHRAQNLKDAVEQILHES